MRTLNRTHEQTTHDRQTLNVVVIVWLISTFNSLSVSSISASIETGWPVGS